MTPSAPVDVARHVEFAQRLTVHQRNAEGHVRENNFLGDRVALDDGPIGRHVEDLGREDEFEVPRCCCLMGGKRFVGSLCKEGDLQVPPSQFFVLALSHDH